MKLNAHLEYPNNIERLNDRKRVFLSTFLLPLNFPVPGAQSWPYLTLWAFPSKILSMNSQEEVNNLKSQDIIIFQILFCHLLHSPNRLWMLFHVCNYIYDILLDTWIIFTAQISHNYQPACWGWTFNVVPYLAIINNAARCVHINVLSTIIF